MNKLAELGFKGDINWIYNEEGSGAKFFNSSVYFPDSLTEPRTKSGITIDPGLDLGNASAHVVREILNLYAAEGLLSAKQKSLLNECIGLDTFGAIMWLKENRKYFKGKFLVPDELAIQVLQNYTGPHYWKPLTAAMPGLLKIRTEYMTLAIHTALLSHSYNRGYSKLIFLAREFIQVSNYQDLAKNIRSVFHNVKALAERRKREAQLILGAIKQRNKFYIGELAKINPLPTTVIQGDLLDMVWEKVEMDLDKIRGVPLKTKTVKKPEAIKN